MSETHNYGNPQTVGKAVKSRAAIQKCLLPHPVYEAHLGDGRMMRMSFWSPLKAGDPVPERGRTHFTDAYEKGSPLVDGYVHWNGARVRDPLFAPAVAAPKPARKRPSLKETRQALDRLLACLKGETTDRDEIRAAVTHAIEIAA